MTLPRSKVYLDFFRYHYFTDTFWLTGSMGSLECSLLGFSKGSYQYKNQIKNIFFMFSELPPKNSLVKNLFHTSFH